MRCGIDLICVHEAHGIVIIIERLCRSRRLNILFLQPIEEVKPVSCCLSCCSLRQRIRTENRIAAHISQAEIIPALVCQRLRSVCRNRTVGVYIDIAPPRHRAIAAYPCICVVNVFQSTSLSYPANTPVTRFVPGNAATEAFTSFIMFAYAIP